MLELHKLTNQNPLKNINKSKKKEENFSSLNNYFSINFQQTFQNPVKRILVLVTLHNTWKLLLFKK